MAQEKSADFRDRRRQRALPTAQSLLAVNQVTTHRWSFMEDVLGYHDAGITQMGVWRPKLDKYGEERGIDLVHDTKMSVSSVSWAGCFTGQNGHSYAESLEDARDTLRIAGALEADCVVMLSGSQSGHIYNHAKRLFVSALDELGDLAGEVGVKLAVQPMRREFAHDWTFISTINETLDVIDACDHEMVGMAFDVYHLWQEPNLEQRIAEIAHLVSTVQLNDYHRPPQSEYDRGMIGEGTIPLADITHAFLDAGYRGAFEIAIWSEELWKTNYDRLLKDCRSRFENILAPSRSAPLTIGAAQELFNGKSKATAVSTESDGRKADGHRRGGWGQFVAERVEDKRIFIDKLPPDRTSGTSWGQAADFVTCLLDVESGSLTPATRREVNAVLLLDCPRLSIRSGSE